jgi:hypothetical protein
MGKYDDVRGQWVGQDGGFNKTPTITDTSALVAKSNARRVWLFIQNKDSANNVHLGLAESATVTGAALITLAPGGGFLFDKNNPWQDAIYAACDAGKSAIIHVVDVSQNILPGPPVEVLANVHGE